MDIRGISWQAIAALRGGEEVQDEEEVEEEEDGDQSQNQSQEVGSVRILGIYFSLERNGWQENWSRWQERVLGKVKRWKQWRLSLFQKVQYINTYCVPAATFVASVYLPPKRLMDQTVGEIFEFLWGTKFFPLPRVEAYRAVDAGGLGLKALGPWLTSQFVAVNFGGWWRECGGGMGREGGDGEEGGGEDGDDLDDLDDDDNDGNDDNGNDDDVNSDDNGDDNSDDRRGGGDSGRERGIWREFERMWKGTAWVQKQRKMGGGLGRDRSRWRLTKVMREELPGYFVEGIRWMKEMGITVGECAGRDIQGGRGLETEKEMRNRIYQRVLDEWLERAEHQRRLKSESVSRYRLEGAGVGEVFTDRTIPYSLWEVRWRSYHQVLNVGGKQPWRGGGQQECKRVACRKGFGIQAQRETIEHYVKTCPAARKMWEAVGKKLRWGQLVDQDWETIVSGIQPEGRLHPGVGLGRRNKGHGPVPWAVVRLVNYLVIVAIGLHGRKEKSLREGREAAVEPWANYVLRRLQYNAAWEKQYGVGGGRRKGCRKGCRNGEVDPQWKKRWAWMLDYPLPIT